jgi:hypothetical protein
LNGTYVGQAYSSDVELLTSALQTQSNRNGWAAIAAGCSAIFQVVSAFCWASSSEFEESAFDPLRTLAGKRVETGAAVGRTRSI